MNIFALASSYDPTDCAELHCDQHLHKMILESAQMVSTAMHHRWSTHFAIIQHMYKPSYHKHPCTIWAGANNHNTLWLCELGIALNQIRLDTSNCSDHSSVDVLRHARDFLEDVVPLASFTNHSPHPFCGPATIGIRQTTYPETWQKYREFYRRKAINWKAAGRLMTYTNRPVPEWIADLITE